MWIECPEAKGHGLHDAGRQLFFNLAHRGMDQPQYPDYLWTIEDDVCMLGGLVNFMAAYHADSSDLIRASELIPAKEWHTTVWHRATTKFRNHVGSDGFIAWEQVERHS